MRKFLDVFGYLVGNSIQYFVLEHPVALVTWAEQLQIAHVSLSNLGWVGDFRKNGFIFLILHIYVVTWTVFDGICF